MLKSPFKQELTNQGQRTNPSLRRHRKGTSILSWYLSCQVLSPYLSIQEIRKGSEILRSHSLFGQIDLRYSLQDTMITPSNYTITVLSITTTGRTKLLEMYIRESYQDFSPFFTMEYSLTVLTLKYFCTQDERGVGVVGLSDFKQTQQWVSQVDVLSTQHTGNLEFQFWELSVRFYQQTWEENSPSLFSYNIVKLSQTSPQ